MVSPLCHPHQHEFFPTSLTDEAEKEGPLFCSVNGIFDRPSHTT